MREWCGCGADVRGRRVDVLTWRKDHRCVAKPEQDIPGQYGGGSDTQINYQQTDMSLGFRPN